VSSQNKKTIKDKFDRCNNGKKPEVYGKQINVKNITEIDDTDTCNGNNYNDKIKVAFDKVKSCSLDNKIQLNQAILLLSKLHSQLSDQEENISAIEQMIRNKESVGTSLFNNEYRNTKDVSCLNSLINSRKSNQVPENPSDNNNIYRNKVNISNITDMSSSFDNNRVAVYMLSPFRVTINDELVTSWANNKAKSIFKYLLTFRDQAIHKEVLMNIFWPDNDSDSARNNLNVNIYSLRKSLKSSTQDISIIVHRDNMYSLDPNLAIWIDSEAFISLYKEGVKIEKNGDIGSAMKYYHQAEALYQSEYLAEDRYESWLYPVKHSYKLTYMNIADKLAAYAYSNNDLNMCVSICTKALGIDQCNEETHRLLMQCYAELGYIQLAIRQYHICREELRRELSVLPATSTVELYDRIRRRVS